MTDYRCYSLGLSGSIQAARDITCEDDDAAIAKARELFHPRAFEVWQGQRRIYPAAGRSGGIQDSANYAQEAGGELADHS